MEFRKWRESAEVRRQARQHGAKARKCAARLGGMARRCGSAPFGLAAWHETAEVRRLCFRHGARDPNSSIEKRYVVSYGQANAFAKFDEALLPRGAEAQAPPHVFGNLFCKAYGVLGIVKNTCVEREDIPT